MKPFFRFAPLVLLFIAVAGCHPVSPLGPAGAPPGAVTHVVIMWLYDPGDQTALDEVLAAGKTLETISGVMSVSGGKMLRSDRPVVDNSYDVAYAITFESEDAMHRYLEDPKHVDIKKTVLDRYVKKYQVYDFIAK